MSYLWIAVIVLLIRAVASPAVKVVKRYERGSCFASAKSSPAGLTVMIPSPLGTANADRCQERERTWTRSASQ